jgi:hypothetical protein
MVEKIVNFCPYCKDNGRHRLLHRNGGLLYCKKCGWKMSHYESTLEGTIQRWADQALINLPKLRVYNPKKIRNEFVNQLYWEAYYNAMIGEYHVSLVMQGILMETLVKEIIFLEENKYFSGEFNPSIEHAQKRKYITDSEYDFLKRVKNEIRNPYTHTDVNKLTGRYSTDIFWVEGEEGLEKSVNFVHNVGKKILNNQVKKGRINGGSSGPASYYILNIVNEKICIPLLNEAYDFLIDICARHFNDDAFKKYEQKYGPLINMNDP